MKWLKAAAIAFSMYSKIPMPMAEWKEENLKYSLCFFPFVGAVIGLILVGWWNFADYIEMNIGCRTLAAGAIPLIITGGIHMDGYLDTIDAISSYQSREKRLQILKDPHLGAFAVIYFGIYLLIYLACLFEIDDSRMYWMAAGGFIFSRALSGMAILYFPCANESGLCYTFQTAANKKVVLFSLSAIALLIILFWLDISFFTAISLLFVTSITFFSYWRMANKKFGGITGDLAGYFLQICERNILIIIIIGKYFHFF